MTFLKLWCFSFKRSKIFHIFASISPNTSIIPNFSANFGKFPRKKTQQNFLANNFGMGDGQCVYSPYLAPLFGTFFLRSLRFRRVIRKAFPLSFLSFQ